MGMPNPFYGVERNPSQPKGHFNVCWRNFAHIFAILGYFVNFQKIWSRTINGEVLLFLPPSVRVSDLPIYGDPPIKFARSQFCIFCLPHGILYLGKNTYVYCKKYMYLYF